MKSYKLVFLAMCATALSVLSMAHAAPVAFDITAASLTTGTGYGNSSDKLDVKFTNTFVAQNLTLSAVGDSFSFKLGTVKYNEEEIKKSETDNLGVSWLLTFSNPLDIEQTISAVAAATLGDAKDATSSWQRTTCKKYKNGRCNEWNYEYVTTPELIDYSLVWDEIYVDFGNGGRFSIDLDDLYFTTQGSSKDQYATIKLLAASQEAVTADVSRDLPEPGSVALLGLGLAGLAAIRRKKKE